MDLKTFTAAARRADASIAIPIMGRPAEMFARAHALHSDLSSALARAGVPDQVVDEVFGGLLPGRCVELLVEAGRRRAAAG